MRSGKGGSGKRTKAGRGIVAWLMSLILGSAMLAVPLLLSMGGPAGNYDQSVFGDLRSLSERLEALDASVQRDSWKQASVDIGRAADNLSLEKGITPYEELVARPNATGVIDFPRLIETDASSKALALIALAEQSDNGTNKTVVDMAHTYEQGIGQGQSIGQCPGQAPRQDQDQGQGQGQGRSSAGSWNGDAVATALSSYALQKSSRVTRSNLTFSVEIANIWILDNVPSDDAAADPAEMTFSTLALADTGRDVAPYQSRIVAAQSPNGSIGDPETTAWAAVALTKTDRPEFLAAAGNAVRWLDSQRGLNCSNVAVASYAEKTYERKYLEVNASICEKLPAPPSTNACGDGQNPVRIGAGDKTPQWLAPLGMVFLALGAVGLFARLWGDERILNRSRNQILDYLRREPGQHQSGIQRALGLSSGSAVYNLRVLEDKGYITAHRDGRHKRFYVNGNSLRPVANGMTKFIVSALRNINTRRMAIYLLGRPGAPQKELSEKLHLDPSTVHWHAGRLEKVGILRTEHVGRNVAYHLERPEIVHQILSFIP
jgi:DNA-binding MarR family transcriptional regulator